MESISLKQQHWLIPSHVAINFLELHRTKSQARQKRIKNPTWWKKKIFNEKPAVPTETFVQRSVATVSISHEQTNEETVTTKIMRKKKNHLSISHGTRSPWENIRWILLKNSMERKRITGQARPTIVVVNLWRSQAKQKKWGNKHSTLLGIISEIN